jgi:hypothetical protein
MNSHIRDNLWNASFEIFYDCYFEEMIADRLVHFWSVVDDITKWLVAITASGSAVAGWALWSGHGYKEIWLLLSMTASLLSITHSALGIQGRIKTWAENKKAFVILRMEMQAIRQDMTIDPEFDGDAMKKRLESARSNYQAAMSQLSSESFRCEKLELKIQIKLNEVISDQIKE